METEDFRQEIFLSEEFFCLVAAEAPSVPGPFA